nr:MAG TPA: hypothetical protein [Caudoviricetes sp.]
MIITPYLCSKNQTKLFMKFTKQQLLDTLKAKLTANGKHLSISDKTIKSLSDSHFDLLVNEETELDELVSKLLPQFVSLNGNYEKDNADFIKKWNTEHPRKDPKEEPGGNNNNGNEPNDAMSKLLKRLEALEQRGAEYETERLVSGKRSELLAKLKEKGINDTKWVDAYMKKLTLTKDSDIEKELSDAEEFYNTSHSSTKTNTPGASGLGDGGEKVDFSDIIGIINPSAGE